MMTVRQRILAIRLEERINKSEENKKYAESLGIKAETKKVTDTTETKKEVEESD